MVTWHIETARLGSDGLRLLLADGWEPFAVYYTTGEHASARFPVVVLRKKYS